MTVHKIMSHCPHYSKDNHLVHESPKKEGLPGPLGVSDPVHLVHEPIAVVLLLEEQREHLQLVLPLGECAETSAPPADTTRRDGRFERFSSSSQNQLSPTTGV